MTADGLHELITGPHERGSEEPVQGGSKSLLQDRVLPENPPYAFGVSAIIDLPVECGEHPLEIIGHPKQCLRCAERVPQIHQCASDEEGLPNPEPVRFD